MLKAMIVEDNAIYRYAIKSIIRWEDYGFQIVSEALNGVHALDLLQQQPVDLILTDISMPEMNGIELIQKVKQDDVSIKIVALSSFDDFRFVKEALKLGAEDYLLKHDLEPESLQQLLHQMNTKIEADQHQKRQANIRDANLQEMWHLLGRKLLFGELKTVEEMEEQAKAIQFPMSKGPTAVILIEGECNKSGGNGTFFSQLEGTHVRVPISDNRSVIMTYMPNEKSERACNEELLRQADLFMKESGGNSTLTVGLSSIGYGLKDWPMLYKQAEAALERSIYEGTGQVYAYASKKSTATEGKEISMKALSTAIQNGQFSEVDMQTELFFDLLLERKPPLAEVKSYLHELAILAKATAIGRGTFTPSAEVTFRQLNILLEPMPSFHHWQPLFRDWMKEMICESKGHVPFRKEIQTAIAYMEEHYAEDITVALLAENLQLSANYLSNLFKSETGLRFVEYLNRCRIRKAKLLLQDASLKVYEVAEKTGFQETSYFCKVFKELEGKTVKEFRCES